eukprot:5817981-Pyramimonas_sp.AAC.1
MRNSWKDLSGRIYDATFVSTSTSSTSSPTLCPEGNWPNGAPTPTRVTPLLRPARCRAGGCRTAPSRLEPA